MAVCTSGRKIWGMSLLLFGSVTTGFGMNWQWDIKKRTKTARDNNFGMIYLAFSSPPPNRPWSIKNEGTTSKAIDFTSPRTSSGQASWPYEMVPYGTILSPSEGGRKPRAENHQALAVKGERHPTCSLELNPGRNGERRTCYHGATKTQFK